MWCRRYGVGVSNAPGSLMGRSRVPELRGIMECEGAKIGVS